MWSLFRSKNKTSGPGATPIDFSFLGCDLHSHLVPGIDDGSQSLEQSLEMIKGFSALGYKKLITTPHVMGDFYDNSKETITEKFELLKHYVAENGVEMEMGVSAEYFLDYHFLEHVLPKGLISFGDNFVLVEVSTAGWPRVFDEIIFAIQSQGYQPILAHPERYTTENEVEFYENIKSRGVLMQMNLLSILGYYGKEIKTMAEKMLDKNMYDFCGSDVHHERHIGNLQRMLNEQPSTVKRLAAYEHFKNSALL